MSPTPAQRSPKIAKRTQSHFWDAVLLALASLAGSTVWLWTGGPPTLAQLDPRAAVLTDPAAPERWCDFAESLPPRLPLARYAMNRAVALGPASPFVLYRAAGFDPAAALPLLHRILDSTPEYDEVVFGFLDRLDLPAARVMETVLPPDARPARAWLRHLVENDRLADSAAAWRSLLARSSADQPSTVHYIDYLLRCRRHQEAAGAWTDYLGPRRGGYRRSNYLFNPGFEPPSGSPFDWRIAALDAAEITARDGVLSIRFLGRENVDFHHVSQQASLPPGRWLFESEVRADEVTTGEGLFVNLSGAGVSSEPISGSFGWQRLSLAFDVPSPGRLVTVEFLRRPSLKFDNKIAGVVSFRALRLVKVP